METADCGRIMHGEYVLLNLPIEEWKLVPPSQILMSHLTLESSY